MAYFALLLASVKICHYRAMGVALSQSLKIKIVRDLFLGALLIC